MNRLTQTSTSSRQIQYLYNGLGQRIGKIDNGVQTNYLIDPNGILPQVMAETDASNNLIAFYVYDGAGLVAKISSQNQYYFYHYDGLGSTIAITDNTGQVVNTYCYSPEGLVGAQETIPNPFQYVGRFGVMAEGNGLYCMGARYYDPEVGRFINKDPIGYAGGINLFTYVGNNPINLTDPLGFGPLIVTVNYRASQYGSFTMVWDNSLLPTFYGSGTLGYNGKIALPFIYKYKYGQHPMYPQKGKRSYPALNVYTLSGSRDIPAFNLKTLWFTYIHGLNVHKGYNRPNSGSLGCHVIPVKDWDNFMENVPEGSSGLYINLWL
ncbi:MAG: RHS repeat-associated core domain-containing protein [Deltaproteobacteria bacterium]|nr:RHS repeat-associated core domain-containing protein [Deltaproteobacteria bacterium]